ncbi:hypothetical protein LEP1GSC016_0297 [Leptospira borgpetersenii serovar Hardjo-bovis str. Sponselee]|uniref:Uncharacterized protein n=5 Tax=Leptospira borgpetersenii TaxID=174 RepID=M3HT38_LEPBO|nr:hypothetical protein LBBP_02292 [Leptospira borgpetersenii serovar Ballum]EMG00785.1 hypothetical protein LEP1GSC123_0655 [Leptospira borgpetersenii str. 200701203]EMJ81688.1 hypothetical protein LEP1GSC016_0297 [Leptospira borgpetersenii serovar Hardjo-bovis str. Sponselee]EMK12765.1 hypothetical protein LEP1GSC066_0182 [Leptospira sp. serovar Kenya str. Sh9]EMN14862.1 hypothetical protein LEP1GSC055_0499 [Leptospira borgpetersenii str. Brem 307]EMN18138.1 hypothetical protein LEP1GSC056_0
MFLLIVRKLPKKVRRGEKYKKTKLIFVPLGLNFENDSQYLSTAFRVKGE